MTVAVNRVRSPVTVAGGTTWSLSFGGGPGSATPSISVTSPLNATT